MDPRQLNLNAFYKQATDIADVDPVVSYYILMHVLKILAARDSLNTEEQHFGDMMVDKCKDLECIIDTSPNDHVSAFVDYANRAFDALTARDRLSAQTPGKEIGEEYVSLVRVLDVCLAMDIEDSVKATMVEKRKHAKLRALQIAKGVALNFPINASTNAQHSPNHIAQQISKSPTNMNDAIVGTPSKSPSPAGQFCYYDADTSKPVASDEVTTCKPLVSNSYEAREMIEKASRALGRDDRGTAIRILKAAVDLLERQD